MCDAKISAMKTILVPTDFSDTALNAARYAVQLSRQMGTTRILLYNAYQLVVPMPDAPQITLIDDEALRKGSEQQLAQWKEALQPLADSNTVIDCMADNTLLVASIDEVAKEQAADVIVMGITGASLLEEKLIGSTTISVAKATTCPVLIVPPGSIYEPIRTVLFACDFKKVTATTPDRLLKKFLDTFKAKLLVLNVDHRQKHFTVETPFETLLLDTLLQGYSPEYHFIDSPKVVEGIMQFADEHHVQLIITVPKKHGLLEGLFHTSYTKKLAFHTHVPLLLLHEEE